MGRRSGLATQTGGESQLEGQGKEGPRMKLGLGRMWCGDCPQSWGVQEPQPFLPCVLTFLFTSCPLTSSSLGNQNPSSPSPYSTSSFYERLSLPSLGCQSLCFLWMSLLSRPEAK